ncbi:MAG: mannosyltransferase [Flavobacteriia bacterium]
MSQKNRLHIVCLDVPFPADYGGAIDMFYRIRALHKLGYELVLHVFEYGRGKQQELEKYGVVHYYQRTRSLLHLLSVRPFIVQSRKNKRLLENLLKDDAPILFEGIHTAYSLENEAIQKRVTFVRMHNIEHEYYDGLKKNASFLRKLFFRQETNKLKNYQKILAKCSHILAITKADAEKLKKINDRVSILPASVPEIEGSFTTVKRYALFHGNLSVPENEKAALWIIKTLKGVIDTTFPLIIAGKNPHKKLKDICAKNEIELIANPSERKMDQLVQEAQIHVLYTAVPSGIKLKLLACLHSSGHILVNEQMVRGTALDAFCIAALDAKDFKMHFIGLKSDVVSKDEFGKRAAFIGTHFNNTENCRQIQQLIDHYEKH